MSPAPHRVAPPGALAEALDAQIDRVHNGWSAVLDNWRRSEAGRLTIRHVDARVAAAATIYPGDVFRALRETPPQRLRIVILGQDPYHGAGQADGLAFSVAGSCRHPPSLRNVFKELQRDLGLPAPSSGSLLDWARRGVLLLNTSLTVEQGQPASHAEIGWQVLTDEIIKTTSADDKPKVFMLWGAHAQSKAAWVTGSGHCVLQCNHPSPLSANRPPRPFVGCGHFAAASAFLAAADPARGGFDWSLLGAVNRLARG